jgi:hypothetical protein
MKTPTQYEAEILTLKRLNDLLSRQLTIALEAIAAARQKSETRKSA